MFRYLLHWGAIRDYSSVQLTCPGATAGDGGAMTGYYDGYSVAAAYNLVGGLSVIAVVMLVFWAYMGASSTLGRRFILRWQVGFGLSALICALLGFVLLAAGTTAADNACNGSLGAMTIPLPWKYVWTRVGVGLLWGPVMYLQVSLVATQTIGRIAGIRNGFFHNRGCPMPRYLN